MGAGFSRLLHDLQRRILSRITVEQRRAQRAVGIGADENGQGNL